MDLLKELLKQNERLDEGFMDYTVMGSDSAADAFSDLCDGMAKLLQGALKEKGNQYNTSGPVNVAMIYNEYLIKFSGVNDRLSEVANMTKSLLQDEIDKFENKTQNPLVKILDKLKKFK